MAAVSITVLKGAHAGLSAAVQVGTEHNVLFTRRKNVDLSDHQSAFCLPNDKEISSKHMMVRISVDSGKISAFAWDAGSTNGSYQVISGTGSPSKRMKRLATSFEDAVCFNSGCKFIIGATLLEVCFSPFKPESIAIVDEEMSSTPQPIINDNKISTLEETKAEPKLGGHVVAQVLDVVLASPMEVASTVIPYAVCNSTLPTANAKQITDPLIPTTADKASVIFCGSCAGSILEHGVRTHADLPTDLTAEQLQRLLSQVEKCAKEFSAMTQRITGQLKAAIKRVAGGPPKSRPVSGGKRKSVPLPAVTHAGVVTTEDACGNVVQPSKRRRSNPSTMPAAAGAVDLPQQIDQLFEAPATSIRETEDKCLPISRFLPESDKKNHLWSVSVTKSCSRELEENISSQNAFLEDEYSQSHYVTALLSPRRYAAVSQVDVQDEVSTSGAAIDGLKTEIINPDERAPHPAVSNPDSPRNERVDSPGSEEMRADTDTACILEQPAGEVSDDMEGVSLHVLRSRMEAFGMKPGTVDFMRREIEACEAALVELQQKRTVTYEQQSSTLGEAPMQENRGRSYSLKESVVAHIRSHPMMHDRAILLEPIDLASFEKDMRMQDNRKMKSVDVKDVLTALGLSVCSAWR